MLGPEPRERMPQFWAAWKSHQLGRALLVALPSGSPLNSVGILGPRVVRSLPLQAHCPTCSLVPSPSVLAGWGVPESQSMWRRWQGQVTLLASC